MSYHRQKISPEETLFMNIGKFFRWIASPFTKKVNSGQQIRSIDKNKIHQQWTEIQNLQALGGPSHMQKALVAADKLLDYALQSLGYKGETMALRLRSAQNRFTNYQDIWYAHGLRNRLVHDLNVEIMNYEIQKAFKIYEKALKDLRVI